MFGSGLLRGVVLLCVYLLRGGGFVMFWFTEGGGSVGGLYLVFELFWFILWEQFLFFF